MEQNRCAEIAFPGETGVANLKRLMLLGCWTYVDWPGPGWDRLRRLEQLEMTGGDGGVDDLSAVTPGKTADGTG